MNASPRTVPVDAGHPTGGLHFVRRSLAATLLVAGALAIAVSAGLAMNPPTSDTITYTLTTTNTGSQPVNDVRVRDDAIEAQGGTFSCPERSLHAGEQMNCEATVAGPADRAHGTRVTTALLLGVGALSAGAILRRIPASSGPRPGER